MKVLIIIPAYNEARNISNLISEIIELKKIIEIDYLIINDCSTDNTAEICEKNGYNYISLPSNLGIGGAVQTGYKYAFMYNYDVAVQVDGDGQHNVDYIRDMLSIMTDYNADMVIGSRYINKEGFQSTRMRRLGSYILSLLVKTRTKTQIFDITSGFRAVNRSLISLFAKDYPTDFPEPESTTFALLLNKKVIEYPVMMRERAGGKSSINAFISVYYMVKVSLAILLCKRC